MENIGYWDKKYEYISRSTIEYDNWLDTFDDEITKCRTSILDLGCGDGSNTLALLEKCKQVIPCDASVNAISNIIRNFPEVETAKRLNFMYHLPYMDDTFDMIVADQSLHYFNDYFTKRILFNIKRVLKQNGTLLFRVNSINDKNYMQDFVKALDKHFYLNEEGLNVRYFSLEEIYSFFGNGNVEYLEEENLEKDGKQKTLWKGCIRY